MFISPTGAKVTTTGSGGAVESISLERINVGAARLASEVDVDETNLIVVGGPCANAIAAEVMGNPANCAEGFEEGKAVVKLYDTGNNIAMLVAGYSAMDTRRATRVVANYDVYDLSGDEVEVTGTSLTNINVNMPQ